MKKRQNLRLASKFPLSLMASAIILTIASQPVFAQSDSHVVQPGEYLYSIAQHYGLSVSQLKEWNHLTSDDIQAGVQLLVASPEFSDEEVALAETDLVASPNTLEVDNTLVVEPDDNAEIVSPVLQVVSAEEDYSTGTVEIHVVKAGEYLNLIARQYGVTANELRLWNHLTSDTLQIGQELKVIPGTTTPTPVPTDPVPDEEDHSDGDVVSYQVKAGDTLWRIANRFGVTANNLRLWNHLTTDTLQIGQTLKVIPDITTPTYPENPDDHSGDVVTYMVKAGDTLWGIGNRFDVSLNNLRLWNHLTTDFLRIGQELKLIPPVPAPTPTEPDGQTGTETTHIVKAGDTLWALSRRYGVTVNQIKQWNALTSNFLSIGQRLRVTTTTPPTTPPVEGISYTVRAGDTLWRIATRHGVTVAHLKEWNALTSNLLSVGQKLRVTGEATPTPPTSNQYTVRSGDTLWAISRRYGVTVNQLMNWNKLTSNFLAIGQKLTVSVPRETYTVKAGDSLWKIATQFASTVEQLKNWNGLTSNIIYVNQTLIVK